MSFQKRMKSDNQAKDLVDLFGKNWKNLGNLDYVGGWYFKAARVMQSCPKIKAAFVSTNSITQGEQVAILWKSLSDRFNVKIDFAYKTFVWDSESEQKAHVHCVIVAFSRKSLDNKPCRLYDANNEYIECRNINAYLVESPDVFIESRTKPLCDVPPLLTGSQRIDNDLFMFSDEEKNEFVKTEPNSHKYFMRWYGADEFINNRPRWCLYLGKCTPAELRSMPNCYKIIQKVREYRLASKRIQTVKAAEYPHKFGLEIIPDTNFMIIPVVSSEKRRYIPIGFMKPDVLCSNQVNLIPNATLYHFGVLTSSVHMNWMRAVCGRLKSDYRYSKDVVYNNFIWPTPTDAQKRKIEQTAQTILDVRAKYSDCSLADLYDEVTMPLDLRKAHQDNDRAVMAAYGFDAKMTENECVARLLEMYRNLV